MSKVKEKIRAALLKVGALSFAKKVQSYLLPFGSATHMRFPPFAGSLHARIASREAHDYVRYATVALALARLAEEDIAGSIAECGVWKGDLSMFLRMCDPQRKMYLFDTFEGFPESTSDGRFRDTSEEAVRLRLGDSKNVHIVKGIFPVSAESVKAEKFAFVMLDFDHYYPTLEGLKFFYPRMIRGAYLFVHDFNSPESKSACKRALCEFLTDKPELISEIPDQWGSAFFRKL